MKPLTEGKFKGPYCGKPDDGRRPIKPPPAPKPAGPAGVERLVGDREAGAKQRDDGASFSGPHWCGAANQRIEERMKVKVTFETEVPAMATDDEITDWIWYELKVGSIHVSNPLADKEINAKWISWVKL